jgi:hypothetical protein
VNAYYISPFDGLDVPHVQGLPFPIPFLTLKGVIPDRFGQLGELVPDTRLRHLFCAPFPV